MSAIPHIIPSTAAPAIDLRVRDLGRMNYADALALQRRLQTEVIDARRETASGVTGLAHLLLVEHDPPVVTVSRRPGARRHLLATDAMLRQAGVEVAETDRGGDITYHGPGQLVVYPMLDLNRFGFRIDSYMRFLEQVVIDVLARFGIEGVRDSAATGVWVRSTRDAHGLQSVGVESRAQPSSKICAMGVRVSRWVSMHGLALNVSTNLEHFNLIVPCGLAGRGVTSVQRELGEACPAMDQVKSATIDRFDAALHARAAEAARPRGPDARALTP